MAKKKQNTVFSSMGEAVMISLLVVLFVAPFLVASVLTPGYSPTNPSQVSQTPASPVVPESEPTVSETNVRGVNVVDDIRMIVPKPLEAAELESYATGKDIGRFKYRIGGSGETKLLEILNDGTVSKQVKIRFVSQIPGEMYSGGYVLSGTSGEADFMRLDPAEKTMIRFDPDGFGHLELIVEVL